MHFQNHRKSILKKQKLSKPCPYHSRVMSTVDSRLHKHSHSINESSIKSTPKNRNNKTAAQNQQQNRLPKILKNSNHISSDKNPSQKKSIKTEQKDPRQMPRRQRLIDPQYYRYGQRFKIDIDYFQDMKLNNQGWPSYVNIGQVHHARQSDTLLKAQKKVRQIYNDEYYYIRQELQIINRVKQRCKVLKNIEEDKSKYKKLLKNMKYRGNKSNRSFIQTDADQSEKQQAYQNQGQINAN